MTLATILIVSVVFWGAVGYGAYKVFGKSIKARLDAEVQKLHDKVDAKIADVSNKIEGK